MASRRQRPIAQIPLPRYGLNDKDSPFAIHSLEASRMENIEIGEADAYGRLGYSQFGTTSGSGPIQNMHDHRESGGTQIMLRARQATIEKYNTVTSAWNAISLPVTLTANKKVSFATLNDVTIISNGVDSDLKFDGSVITELSSNPKADVQFIYQNRLVKFKFSTSIVYWSDINDPETFDALAFEMIDPNNGQAGKGIADLNGQIIVFKEAKKYLMTALVGGSVVPLDGEISTVSHYSIAATGGSLIFLATSGWYELRGTQTYLISDHLDISQLSKTEIDNAHAVFFNNAYRCFVAERSVAYNNLEYIFHLDIPTAFPNNPYAVTKNRGLNGLCYLKTLRGGQEELYFGDSRPDSGSPSVAYSKVYLMFDGNDDDGAEIAPYWESKMFDERMPFYAKKYKRAYTRVINQTGLTYYVAHRFGTTDSWNEQALSFQNSSLSWIVDIGTAIIEWLEGYDWPFEGASDDFTALTNTGRPRTIQFRNRAPSATAQAHWIYQAYRYRLRDKFK
jgi:hypothetical protein